MSQAIKLLAVGLLVLAVGCAKLDAPSRSTPSGGLTATHGASSAPNQSAAASEAKPDPPADAAVGAPHEIPPGASVAPAVEPSSTRSSADDETAKNIAAATKLTGFIEHTLLYFPLPYPVGDWKPAGLEFEDAHFTAADGTKLHGWFVPHEQARAVVLFAHGNGGNLTHRAGLMRALHDRLRVAVMIFDYRGYGRSEGSPSESGILADARAARAWTAQRAGIKENQIVLMGESLGGGVVVDLAAADGARGLILDSTFSSLPDVAAWHYPWLPTAQLMQTRLDSAAKIPNYHGPLLEFHGDNDQIVPVQFGRKLFAAANEPKQFVLLAGHDHNDPPPEAFFNALDKFFDSLDQRP